jgi:hypothetical protein
MPPTTGGIAIRRDLQALRDLADRARVAGREVHEPLGPADHPWAARVYSKT